MTDALKSRPGRGMCAVFVAASLLYATMCSASCLGAGRGRPVAAAAAGGAQHQGCASEPASAPEDSAPSDCGTHDHDASWNTAKKALGFAPLLPAVEFLAHRGVAHSPGIATSDDASLMSAAARVIVSPLRI